MEEPTAHPCLTLNAHDFPFCPVTHLWYLAISDQHSSVASLVEMPPWQDTTARCQLQRRAPHTAQRDAQCGQTLCMHLSTFSETTFRGARDNLTLRGLCTPVSAYTYSFLRVRLGTGRSLESGWVGGLPGLGIIWNYEGSGFSYLFTGEHRSVPNHIVTLQKGLIPWPPETSGCHFPGS